MNPPAETTPAWLSDYQTLTTSVGYVPLDRTQIELQGKDRASFLHNLCTNEIKKLPVGDGCEAFITSVQGKAVGHGYVYAGPDSLLFDSVGGQSETLLKHLDHYLVCEQVELVDRSESWAELLLAGPDAAAMLSRICGVTLPETRLGNTIADIEEHSIWVRRIDLTAAGGFLLSVQRQDLGWLEQQLAAAQVRLCQSEALEAARIEQGTPLYGRDLTEKTLPQELVRDNLAISFVKGCYLGQETIARIDALGHVNKQLVGLRALEANVPVAGDDILCGEQNVGHVTSAIYSPRLKAPLAMGYVRAAQTKPGTRLTSQAGELEVVALPLA